MLKNNVKKFGSLSIFILLMAILINPIASQEYQMSYLSQKLMLENSLRERVTNALDKLLDDIKFIVDVSVEIVFTPIEQTKTVYEVPRESATRTSQPQPTPSQAETIPQVESQYQERTSPDLSLPLPGFEMPQELVTTDQEISTPALQEGPPSEPAESVTEVPTYTQEVSQEHRVVSTQSIPIPVIKRQQVNIIMEDGITPEIIENVRQVVSIASHYDRARGDVISIMTASFRKRQDQDAAEAIILKNIAEKIDDLEQRQRKAEQIAKIDQQKRAERKAVIRDSLRMEELRKQIADLQTQLDAPQLSEDQREETRMLTNEREMELANLKIQLRESNRRLQELEMTALETVPPGYRNIKDFGLYIILSIFAVALLILLIILLVNRRTHQKRQEMEWGYGTKIPMGPRPQPQQAPQQPTPVKTQPQTVPPPTPPPQPQAAPPKQEPPVDISAIKEEMKGIKQSVISMSVGQPDTASRVLNEWLSQEQKAEESESEFEGGL
jgi:flagellar biosynthesis/type III secretory pathway M-ring protein FliF/YscJ